MWKPVKPAGHFAFDAARVTAHWSRLHASDREPEPADSKVLQAWVYFHRGEFHKAFESGRKLGHGGATVANKAACIYAHYIEPDAERRQEILWEAAEHAQQHAQADPHNANAHFLHALALARYSQGIRVARALALGLGRTVQTALANAIRLQPDHAAAHIALGVFHADIIDKVGSLIGNMTYGANAETCLHMFREGLRLTPASPIALMEYAKALVALEGDEQLDAARRLCTKAIAQKALDAKEHLEIQRAQALLAEWQV